jgi:hypothetical protein
MSDSEPKKMWVAVFVDIDSRASDEAIGVWPTKAEAVKGGERLAAEWELDPADEGELWWIETHEVEVYPPGYEGKVESESNDAERRA